MSLASGTRVGAYEIVGQLGAGGMGEVYRARDTNLHILPDRRIVGVDPATVGGELRAQQLRVVLNWFEGLKRRAPLKPGS